MLGVELPHAYPFLMIDRLLSKEPGCWAVALKNVSRNDPFLETRGTWTPVLLAEIMAQTAGLAVGSERNRHALLVRIGRFRCRAVLPGDRLVVLARVVRRFGAMVKVHCLACVAGRRCAAGEIVLRLVETTAAAP